MPTDREPVNLFGEPVLEPGPDAARKPWYSPSRLRTFADCARRYEFQVVRGLPTRPSPHLDLGSNVHAALRDWMRLPPSGRTWELLLEAYREAWRHNRPAFARRPRAELKEWGERGIAMLRRFFDALPPGVEPLATEKNVRVDFGDFVVGGRVDRIDEGPDGALVVVDYKTGRFPSAPAQARAADLAAPIYAHGASEAFVGAPVARVEYLYLDSMERLAFDVDAAWLADREAGIGDLARQVRAAETRGEFPARPSRACRWCDFTAACAEGRAFLDGPRGRG